MNRLLSFNPEPFETETELEGASQLQGITRSGFGQHCECQHAAARGRSQFLRGTPAVSRAGYLPAFEPEWEISPSARRRTWPRPTPSISQTPSPLPTFDSQTFRQRIVRLANQELARWGNGAIKETDPRIRHALQDYWKSGAGVSYSDAQLGDPAFQKDHAWSAAFISWLMKTAGAGNAFKYSASHAVYTRAAKDNRVANNNNPFKAYRVTELAPQVGDLICKSRAGSGATYDNIRPGMKTHCDLVTDVRPGKVATIGGNVSNSVAQKTLRTDANGRIAEPNYFAVTRIDGKQPSVPPAPPPTPSIGSAPKLIKKDSMPAGITLYVEIDLKITDKSGITAPPVTGIFIPGGYVPGAAVDLILYLHGFKAEAIKRQAIDQYWNSQRFPYGAFREGTNASARNVVLVAPTLGSRSEAGSLLRPGGLDAYFDQVLAALRAYGPQSRSGVTRTLGNLIFACHSGGGWPMRQLAGGGDRALAQLRECWGFDCTYNRGDDAFWAGWARARPNARAYIYYIAGSPTAPLAERLRNKRVPNAIVQPSRDKRHNYVPIAHWRERVQGAPFLAARSGGTISPAPTTFAEEMELAVFTPTPVESPGGGRIQDKRPPPPSDLVIVTGMGGRKVQLHRLAGQAGQALVRAARSDGILDQLLLPTSGYRSPAYQAKLWEQAKRKYGSEQEARKWVAPPGTSPHQSGRAIDFYLGGTNSSDNVTRLRILPAYRWLMANAARFGFYPYWREPWHWEYNPPARDGTKPQPPQTPPIAPSPPSVVDTRKMSRAQFIEFVGANARRAMDATGVPASVTVAQAILETGWGKHTIGEAKNLFGIKGRGPAGSIRAPTREFINGKWVTVDADFAKYDSFEQSITEHARFFLRNRRYARALQFKGDPDAFAREIHKAGYATGPNYAAQLIELMRSYNLYRFDLPLKYELSA